MKAFLEGTEEGQTSAGIFILVASISPDSRFFKNLHGCKKQDFLLFSIEDLPPPFAWL